MAKPTRVLVVDAHPAARAGIRRALAVDGFAICAEAGEAGAAVAAAVREEPDLCLVDVGIPGGGVAAAAGIKRRLPATTVVMMTTQLEEDDLLASLRAGANGYLPKDTVPARLPHVLAGVLAGEAALPRKMTGRVLEELRSRSGHHRLLRGHRKGATLTAREWQVLEALRNRTPTSEIAARLSVSPVTVRRHISAIVGKLRVQDRHAAVRLFDA